MQASHDVPGSGSPDSLSLPRSEQGGFGVALRVAADTGFGIWALQGMGLAFGIFRNGRGESLVPLVLGVVLVGAGLLVATLRVPGWPAWYGWHPGRGARPRREAMVALATCLPMLAVAGLTRGENDFWATRMAGAVLVLCCLGHLLYSAYRLPGRRIAMSPPVGTLPASRVMAALYGGGLWLWLCVAADSALAWAPATPEQQPWLLLLMVTALLLGLLEGMRWHALRAAGRAPGLVKGRFLAAVLSHALPCLALLLADRWQASGVLAGVAAVSNLSGRAVEQWLYLRECAGVPKRHATA